MYEQDLLREYINNSELRIFSKEIKVRLSKELAQKYDQGYYNNYLKNIQMYLNMINTLEIKYPGNAKPILYIYVVPDNNYSKLLRIPAIFDKGKGNGKPVSCYDIDGFNWAYGLSQNLLENRPEKEDNISRIENEIHELSHIIHSQFFSTNQTICEGFAEALPLFALDLEEIFDEHREVIQKLNENQILTAHELLNSEKDGSFGSEEILPNKSCSFRLSYISSYLFIRGCMEVITAKYDFSKAQSTQYFLEIIKQSNCRNEWLIYDISNAIGIPQNELLNGKQIQMKALNSLSSQKNLSL